MLEELAQRVGVENGSIELVFYGGRLRSAHASLATSCDRVVGWHIARATTRASIERAGLIPGRPRPRLSMPTGTGPVRLPGVYCWETFGCAYWSAADWPFDDTDIWRVDVAGLPTVEDPYNRFVRFFDRAPNAELEHAFRSHFGAAFYAPVRVAPDRLTLALAAEEIKRAPRADVATQP